MPPKRKPRKKTEAREKKEKEKLEAKWQERRRNTQDGQSAAWRHSWEGGRVLWCTTVHAGARPGASLRFPLRIPRRIAATLNELIEKDAFLFLTTGA